MSHHNESFSFEAPSTPTFLNGKVTLPIAGQGVVIFSPEGKTTKIEFSDTNEQSVHDKYKRFSIEINEFNYSFYASKNNWTSSKDNLFTCETGYDKYHKGPFWLSIDFENRLLKGGYGEPRTELVLFSFRFNTGELAKHKNLEPNLNPSEADDPAHSPYKWIKELKQLSLSDSAELITVFKDPITVPVAMAVKSMDKITMADAANFNATTPVNLPTVCQKLYGNVGGANFNLATINEGFNLPSDFDFAKAVQYSIDTPGKICNSIIASKVKEFGNPDMVYLRITMGGNQGESPGIPYVMEIWPSNKRSPIHNHGGSEAIIKVLHGQIECKMYATLSQDVPKMDLMAIEKAYEPDHFKTCVFKKDQVTYITPWLNQIHQLRNPDPINACITIQCYGYPEGNDVHYEYFNWLNTANNEIDNFFPDSDYNFSKFVVAIFNEYSGR